MWQVGDVGCAVHLCTLLHQRYAEFSSLLLEQLQKLYSSGIKKEEDKVRGGGWEVCMLLEMSCYCGRGDVCGAGERSACGIGEACGGRG